MLQLEVVGDTLGVIAAAREALPEDVRERPELRLPCAVDMIRRMLRNGGFSGRRVVTALPREIVHVKNLRLPLIPPDELEAAVKFEARNVFPFDTGEACVHHLPAGEVRQGNDIRQEVIVMAARHEDVNNHLEHLHRAGIVIESLDFEPFAAYRAFERFIRRREDEQNVHVVVDIGARASQVIIGKGRDISFLKPIEIGGRHFHEAVARTLGISIEEARSLRRRLMETGDSSEGDSADGAARRDPVKQAVFDATRRTMEELGREISLCLRYYSVTFRGQRPNRLRVVGGEAWDPQLQSVLSGSLTIPVEIGRPLFSADVSRIKPGDRRGHMSEWAIAFGLGLKMTKGRFGPRDGKPRDPNEPPAAPDSSVEVVDLNAALLAGETPSTQPVQRPASSAPSRILEATHA